MSQLERAGPAKPEGVRLTLIEQDSERQFLHICFLGFVILVPE